MKNSILLLCCSLITVTSFCQAKYLPGYLLTLGGDTVSVELQEENRNDLKLQVTWRKPPSQDLSSFRPGEIRGFGYKSGGIYKSIEFSDNPRDTTARITIFAEQILAGAYELYIYEKNDQPVYVIKHENKSYLLTNTTYLRTGEIDETGNYQNQLVFLSVACSDIQKDVERVYYDDKNIIRFLRNLSQCTNPETAVTEFRHKEKTRLEVLAFAGGLPVNSSFQYTVEAMARFSNPKINRNIYINIGLRYSRSPFVETDRNSANILYKLKTTDILFSLPVSLQYNFTSGIIQPFLGVGFSLGMLKETSAYYSWITTLHQFKVSFLGELGIEAYITRQLMIKAVLRDEGYLQYPVLGIAWKFR